MNKRLTVIIDRVIGTVRSAIYDPVNKYYAEVNSSRELKTTSTVSGTIPLPTGAATAAKQDAQTAILADIETNTGLTATEVTLEALRVLIAALDAKVTACNTGAVVVSSGTLTGITNPVAVTGTFWQATQPVSGTVGVNNFPTEYPLPAAQVATLTPLAHPTEFPLPTSQVTTLTPAPKFEVNEIEEASATLQYIGAENAAGDWWIRSLDTTSGFVFGHATELNNVTYTDYSTAWTNRATLTYGDYSEAF